MSDNASRLHPGEAFPDLSFQRVGGGRVSPSDGDGWRMLVVYRGKHCPMCTRYLATLERLREQFRDAGIQVMAVSADPLEKAAAEVDSEGWSFPVGYDMDLQEMKTLGLYVSEPRSPEETDRPFAEPAVFVINPDDQLQTVDVSNAPFSRPGLEELLQGLKFVQEKNYPVRGTLAA
ncbi:MAG: AhpC/TSA family protein [Pseudomonadota bacterium]|nr:AhpC/TSA family protein [Pseudomonadota bacterium]